MLSLQVSPNQGTMLRVSQLLQQLPALAGQEGMATGDRAGQAQLLAPDITVQQDHAGRLRQIYCWVWRVLMTAVEEVPSPLQAPETHRALQASRHLWPGLRVPPLSSRCPLSLTTQSHRPRAHAPAYEAGSSLPGLALPA